MTIRVVIADDQALVRAGFVALLADNPGYEVLAEVGDGAHAITAAAEHRPDVILMDIHMPGVDGIAATRHITNEFPAVKVLILTTFDLDEHVYAALRAGASGFLLKDAPPEQLLHAIDVIAAGEALLAPSITRRLIADFSNHTPPPTRQSTDLDELTPRERDVLTLVAGGLTNTQIAAHLTLSEGTIKTHVTHILAKLDATSRAQAVVAAYENGLVTPGEPTI